MSQLTISFWFTEFKGPLTEYDFIVVGAGSAGSVLASRLSEGRKASVLLLEAGLGESILTQVPALAPLFQTTSSVWPYLMEQQPNVCLGSFVEISLLLWLKLFTASY